MQTYHAVVRAFEKCRLCLDQTQYEEYLFTALEEVLKKPLDNARDLVLVVDGLDELQGAKAVAQPFFEKLADVVCEGKRVKLMGFAQTLSLPSGTKSTHITMTQDKIQDDIRAVILKSLMHCRHLTLKSGPEQEQLLDRIARICNTSFVWAFLASQWLSHQKSSEDFTKTVELLEKSKPSIQDLVQRLYPREELQATTKSVLSIILSAERPLSVSEIRTLQSISPQEGYKGSEEPDVYRVLEPLEVLLSLSDGMIRFKHPDITHAVTAVANSSHAIVPTEERHADMVLRLLNYARTTLVEDTDPTFEEYDPNTVEMRFQEYPLLSYLVRFWAVHFQQLSEPKKPKNLSAVLPTTPILSLMEKALWMQELPLPQTLELLRTVLHIRQTTFNQPTPALVQSQINTAVIYELVRKPSEAAQLYYQSIKTSRTLLGIYHPLPIELGNRFLRITDSMVESKRTETMTHREEVLKILITVLERQYSKTSTQVIEMRTLLAQFYEHIHEVDRASEVYQLIQDANVQLHGRTSSQARNVSNHLKVVLSKSTDKSIETRKESIFDEEEETYEEEPLDIASITRRLKSATTERALVELWQAVSSACRNTASVEWHEKNIEIAVAYSRLLMSQKRSSEASAVMSSICKEYESHQVSYSDRVVARLTEAAMVMKELGQYTAALAILRHTSHVYQNIKRTDSYQLTEIQQQVSDHAECTELCMAE